MPAAVDAWSEPRSATGRGGCGGGEGSARIPGGWQRVGGDPGDRPRIGGDPGDRPRVDGEAGKPPRVKGEPGAWSRIVREPGGRPRVVGELAGRQHVGESGGRHSIDGGVGAAHWEEKQQQIDLGMDVASFAAAALVLGVFA
uniref:Uncharacterized protein n=1 Tax=Oryza barthii TaxID=65489 RepID=A0A0D3F309_9ORYZ